MGQLNLSTHIVRFVNAACPYPYHYNSETGSLREIVIDAYPLGIRSDTQYEEIGVQLASGDYMIFCSDGIAEAENETSEPFSYERTQNLIQQVCERARSAEETIAHIFDKVNHFRGNAAQTDDMTCIVLRITDT